MKTQKEHLRSLLAEYFQELTEADRLTQEKMAEFLRVSSRSYGSMERGEYLISTLPFIYLLHYLGEAKSLELLRLIWACILPLDAQGTEK